MSYAERREAILEVLCIRRHDTYRNLAFEFQVSRETIRQDIAVLMCSYPIENGTRSVWRRRQGCGRILSLPQEADGAAGCIACEIKRTAYRG